MNFVAIIGKNILESLTTGMYSDSKIIYREYIQNACDQIDIAVKENIVSKDEAEINIWLDPTERWISIEDNATGVKADMFQSQLGNIAASDKKVGVNKGFRGIGRLCGLAYCKALRFVTSYKGEKIQSIMEIDALKMRQMLDEDVKYTVDDILNAIVTFKTEKEQEEAHYFKVLLKDINDSNTDLLSQDKVTDYLSFVAPVPYASRFTLRANILEHARRIEYDLEEYKVKINAHPIYKNYSYVLYEGSEVNKKPYDRIDKLAFKEIYDSDNHLLAWLWYGLSRFEKSIPPQLNPMRGFRVRQHNIQIGDNNVVADLFKEARGNGYFVGEIFVVSKNLIPNSQRNYFNENQTRIAFENGLKYFFYNELHNLYYTANKIKTSFEKEIKYNDAVQKYEDQKQKGFVDDNQEAKLKAAVEEAGAKKNEAKKFLDRIKETQEDTPLNDVKRFIFKTYQEKIAEQQKKSENSNSNNKQPSNDEKKNKQKQVYFTDSLSKLSKNDRKLVSKILGIVDKIVDEETAKKIQEEIKKEFS